MTPIVHACLTRALGSTEWERVRMLQLPAVVHELVVAERTTDLSAHALGDRWMIA